MTPIIDLWSQPEWSWLRNEMPFAWQAAQAAVAGEQAMGAITCPDQVGAQQYIVIVEKIAAAGGAATNELQLALQTRAAIAATLAQNPPNGAPSRDTRTSPGVATLGANTRAETWTGSDVAGFANVIDRIATVAANVQEDFRVLPWILKPGTGLVVQHATVNVVCRVTFVGRVRLMNRGEFVTP